NGGPRDRLFFFSRRRRHTRFSRDWSSDVCSSDLHPMSDTWRGEMLRSPELVEAFAGQLRRVLDDLERLVAHVRRDAEPMWHENMPPEYSAIEAALKCRKLTKPLREIQRHLDAAIQQTFALEARYRRIMHEIPQQRAQERTAGHNRLDRGPQHQPITPG